MSSSWKFFRTFLRSPFQMGGVVPSSRILARAVAEVVTGHVSDPAGTPLIEVGPGTGALTRELIRLPNPLILLERNPEFARHLTGQFPGIGVVCEDFLTTTVFSTGNRGAVLVSSLPVRSLPRPEVFSARFRELLLGGNVGAIIQYSYGWRDPLQLDDPRIEARRERFVLRNFPPAFVWVYLPRR